MSDVWKPIEGFEGLYEVAPCGVIRNAKTLRWLSPSVKDDGYMSVKLFRNGKGRNRTVHRIVAEAFIPNPDKKPQVNHKDLNKKNNDVSNLEWVTQAENQSHAIRNGTNKTRISKLKMNEKYHGDFYQMTCLFPPSLFDELDTLAISTGVSKSEMIREAVREYVKRHMAEEGEKNFCGDCHWYEAEQQYCFRNGCHAYHESTCELWEPMPVDEPIPAPGGKTAPTYDLLYEEGGAGTT